MLPEEEAQEIIDWEDIRNRTLELGAKVGGGISPAEKRLIQDCFIQLAHGNDIFDEFSSQEISNTLWVFEMGWIMHELYVKQGSKTIRERLKEQIPPMTDPLGQHWEQPPVSEIELDARYARMKRKTFDALKNYTASQPTGVYAGKMWKRRVDVELLYGAIKEGTENKWQLCWFGKYDIPGYCSNHYREIIIQEEDKP